MRRITVSLPDPLAALVDQAADRDYAPRATIIRQAIHRHLTPTHTTTNEAVPAERFKLYGPPKPVGAGAVTRLRPPGDGEWGHHVVTADLWVVRVLPDGHTSGQKRSHVITQALTDAHEYTAGHRTIELLLGALTLAGASRILFERMDG